MNSTNVKPDWLSHKYFIFCETYIATHNASESARKAGYSAHTAGVTGCTLLKNPKIKRYLDERIQSVQEEERGAVANANEVLEYLTRVMRGQEVTYNYRGEQIPMPATERTRAAQELAKRIVDAPSMDNPVQIIVDIPRPVRKEVTNG